MKFLELPLGAVFTVTDWFHSPTYVKISNVCCPDNSNRTYINAYNRMNDVGALSIHKPVHGSLLCTMMMIT